MTQTSLSKEYLDAKPLIRALEKDLCQYFRNHNVKPEHAIIAMMNISATIVTDGLKTGSLDDATTGAAALIAALTETLTVRTAKAVEDGRLK